MHQQITANTILQVYPNLAWIAILNIIEMDITLLALLSPNFPANCQSATSPAGQNPVTLAHAAGHAPGDGDRRDLDTSNDQRTGQGLRVAN